MPIVSGHPQGSVVEISVRPRAGRCMLAGTRGGRLRVEVNTPPEGGRATRQALRTLAKAAGIAAADAVLLKGAAIPRKTVLLRGIAPAECRARLGIEQEE